jgi:flavin reductase (DIM6/NTAB) family NADH-FMN oxidoreductase RutF
MKKLIIKLLFGGIPPTQYPAVRIPQGKIGEKVVLKKSKTQIDITQNHSIVCQAPFCISVWMDKHALEPFQSGESKIIIDKGYKTISKLGVKILHIIDEKDYYILVFEIQTAKSSGMNFIQRYILQRSFLKNGNLTQLESDIYAALYAYPRGIILVSFRQADYYNIFPMDFQGYYREKDMYILGLRTTNITLEKIIQQGKVVVCVTDDTDISTIYALGKHHSTEPPYMDKLGFDLVKSELFGFPVPAFCKSYKEIEIINHFKVGSHMMLIGKILNNFQESERLSSVYHIYGFYAKNSGYTEIES